jgi:hypothetical protein
MRKPISLFCHDIADSLDEGVRAATIITYFPKVSIYFQEIGCLRNRGNLFGFEGRTFTQS